MNDIESLYIFPEGRCAIVHACTRKAGFGKSILHHEKQTFTSPTVVIGARAITTPSGTTLMSWWSP